MQAQQAPNPFRCDPRDASGSISGDIDTAITREQSWVVPHSLDGTRPPPERSMWSLPTRQAFQASETPLVALENRHRWAVFAGVRSLALAAALETCYTPPGSRRSRGARPALVPRVWARFSPSLTEAASSDASRRGVPTQPPPRGMAGWRLVHHPPGREVAEGRASRRPWYGMLRALCGKRRGFR